MDETSALRMILMELATSLEEGKTNWVTFQSKSEDQRVWLSRMIAVLKTEGSVTEVEGGGGFKLTNAGYQKYLPQITAWRREKLSPPERKANAIGANGDLDLGLLFKIMTRLGELRADRAPFTTSDRLFDLADRADRTDSDQALYVDAHLEFLEGRGYVELGAPLIAIQVRTVKLTTNGVMFVQPELADFGQRSIFPEVAKSLEREVLTYPGENEGLLFKLHEAFAKNAPDVIAKILVEVGARIARGGTA